jgi:bifunctional non-homologous end joining protein LigD
MGKMLSHDIISPCLQLQASDRLILEWQWEVKWDGYRMLAYVENGKVELRSRNDKNYTQRFKIVADDLARWKDSAVIDGEMVVVKENGVSHFNSLENWFSPQDGELRYYVFDILWLNGKTLLEIPLIKRRELLRRRFPKSDLVYFNECFDGMKGIELFEKANHFHLEESSGRKRTPSTSQVLGQGHGLK